MNITINAVKFKTDVKLETFINEKVGKLAKNIDNIHGCDVTLKVEKPESDNNKITEIHLHLPGQTLFASKQADSFEEATAVCIDALKTQIARFKEKY